MSKIQITISKKKDVNDYIRLALNILPVAAFLFSTISCFLTNKQKGMFGLTYLFILAYHGLRVYLQATNKSFFGVKKSSDQLLKRIWFGKHLHIVVISLVFLFFNVYPFLFFLSYALYSLRETVKVIQSELGPRLGDLKETIDNFAKTVNENVYIKRARGVCDVVLAAYLFFAGLFTFKGKFFLSFLVYVVNNVFYGVMGDDQHKWVYKTISNYLHQFTKDNKDARKIVEQVVDVLEKVKDVAKQIYPIPQNAGEAIQAGLKDLKKSL
ncbi:hypothetical protein TRFO_22152 [Tritrichomonas foetus]|uniref:Uncharacterized protein n=1 Tax=Tritrichomonas foetus TaxID=1144522 RepID=A0A1J4KCI6_9EUKA|nr:hypothetical protein TRFO_22152 [Tritrichomonas foetus]|eukprot:OHT09135.1 hypothetical protein TRFO_22152 [Tritrichomonas foetus]